MGRRAASASAVESGVSMKERERERVRFVVIVIVIVIDVGAGRPADTTQRKVLFTAMLCSALLCPPEVLLLFLLSLCCFFLPSFLPSFLVLVYPAENS